jgi:hypothetical protein
MKPEPTMATFTGDIVWELGWTGVPVCFAPSENNLRVGGAPA